MTIKIFATGGSIDKIYSTKSSDFVVADPQIDDILRDANVSVAHEIVSLMKKDSLEITPADRQLIVEAVTAAPQQRIIITHGTDTMIDTAKALTGIPDKVIVLTGAMQPAAFKYTDAAFNIGCAVTAVQTLPDGVYIVMNGKIFDPINSRKNIDRNRFEPTD
jgi:L-asparaginase